MVFTNASEYPVDLVKFVTLPGGKLDNNYFLIVVKDKELPYRGIMKKRAHPDPEDFHWLQPNESIHSAEVCLNDFYPIPKQGGLQLSYSSANHFAGYQQQLTSNPVSLVLGQGTGNGEQGTV